MLNFYSILEHNKLTIVYNHVETEVDLKIPTIVSSYFRNKLVPSLSNLRKRMANPITNIKMTNTIRGMVSKRRKRYQMDGFNLDLACKLFVIIYI